MQPQAGEFEHIWVIDLVRDEIVNGLRFNAFLACGASQSNSTSLVCHSITLFSSRPAKAADKSFYRPTVFIADSQYVSTILAVILSRRRRSPVALPIVCAGRESVTA